MLRKKAKDGGQRGFGVGRGMNGGYQEAPMEVIKHMHTMHDIQHMTLHPTTTTTNKPTTSTPQQQDQDHKSADNTQQKPTMNASTCRKSHPKYL
jgi:hypothetical protein